MAMLHIMQNLYPIPLQLQANYLPIVMAISFMQTTITTIWFNIRALTSHLRYPKAVMVKIIKSINMRSIIAKA